MNALVKYCTNRPPRGGARYINLYRGKSTHLPTPSPTLVPHTKPVTHHEKFLSRFLCVQTVCGWSGIVDKRYMGGVGHGIAIGALGVLAVGGSYGW